MNVLFLTMARIGSLSENGVYTDLIRQFSNQGHVVYVVTPSERSLKQKTYVMKEFGGSILKVWTLNLQKTNIVEKGLGLIFIEYQFLRAIKKHFKNVNFQLVLYSTPPITFSKVVKFIQNRDKAFSYLLLKDIFPQNAVDMKLLKKGSLLHKFFLRREQLLYDVSDAIGCMSDANYKYILDHNPHINSNKVEVNPNSIEPRKIYQSFEEKHFIRQRYGLPLDKKIFVYGGNLGIPQGVSFVMETIENTANPDVFFLIIGSGTEFSKIESWFSKFKPQNAVLQNGVLKHDFEILLKACDIGMIFLHKDFTIPNFPSRLLSYLEMELPIIVAADPNTDVGTVVEKAGCGYSVLWGDQVNMQSKINILAGLSEEKYEIMKNRSWELLLAEFDVKRTYELIIKRLRYV